MNLEDDVRTTVIKLRTLEEKPNRPDTDLNVREATQEDFDCLESSDEHSSRDIRILRNSDICVVVRDKNDIVHHTCVALETFRHSRTPLQIKLSEGDSYIYNVWTRRSHRRQGIFQTVQAWLASQLYRVKICNLFSEIDTLNKPSLQAFRKAEFQKVGERHTIDAGEFAVHMICGKNIYADTAEITTQIGDINIAKTREKRFLRIRRELHNYIDQHVENGDQVALFGAGNHAQRILHQTDIGSLADYAIDEDTEKIGSNIPNSSVPVHSVDKISEQNPDYLIICSEAFQNDMATRAREQSGTTNIIVLYPHVSLFDENG